MKIGTKVRINMTADGVLFMPAGKIASKEIIYHRQSDNKKIKGYLVELVTPVEDDCMDVKVIFACTEKIIQGLDSYKI